MTEEATPAGTSVADVPEPAAEPVAPAPTAGQARRPPPGVEPVRPSDTTLVEAVLTVAERPVGIAEFATALDIPARRVERLLAELAGRYEREERGFRLRHVGRGWRLYTADECAPWVERFVLAGQSARLSQAALETLAIVAYQQPVSRGRVAAVRGVSADGVIRTLTARNLIEECGHDHESGAILYRTTDYFLERMGLRGLDELPRLAPLLPGVADVDDIVAS
ncbi:SMC-Scp complex subunit ScpB [Parafrankia colletiae]|uniref:SMC-Scp complex subunit ScpB n=1 Tax=Parafrankia colletiae TaxID=573497 RepID=A0A1S1R1W6_9ACTN|nr:SMC-Scp complex subunit ScpB [Parafrankia colletiae]MCK9898752.1 SMC-Scp complex subunit ScpB [Frankia sp. Cpl3]OHV39515.1 SMC-Scp complex subunit ScpB [Parafrankia colletiae]